MPLRCRQRADRPQIFRAEKRANLQTPDFRGPRPEAGLCDGPLRSGLAKVGTALQDQEEHRGGHQDGADDERENDLAGVGAGVNEFGDAERIEQQHGGSGHDGDGAGGEADQLLGDAAQQQAGQLTAPAPAQHDHLDRVARGDSDQ